MALQSLSRSLGPLACLQHNRYLNETPNAVDRDMQLRRRKPVP